MVSAPTDNLRVLEPRDGGIELIERQVSHHARIQVSGRDFPEGLDRYADRGRDADRVENLALGGGNRCLALRAEAGFEVGAGLFGVAGKTEDAVHDLLLSASGEKRAAQFQPFGRVHGLEDPRHLRFGISSGCGLFLAHPRHRLELLELVAHRRDHSDVVCVCHENSIPRFKTERKGNRQVSTIYFGFLEVLGNKGLTGKAPLASQPGHTSASRSGPFPGNGSVETHPAIV
jgi:hypothetical protein